MSAGRSIDEAVKPIQLKCGETKVGLLDYVAGA